MVVNYYYCIILRLAKLLGNLMVGTLELHVSNQVRVVAVSLPQLKQASFIQKNQTLQNRFLISVTLR